MNPDDSSAPATPESPERDDAVTEVREPSGVFTAAPVYGLETGLEVNLEDTQPISHKALASSLGMAQTRHWEFNSSRLIAPDEAAATLDGPGEHIVGSRYKVVGELAVGGMAKLYRVAHLHLKKVFALKIIHHNLSDRPNVRKLFAREARVLSRLNHPNIVQVTDFGTDPRFGAYLVMEFLEGESLHSRIRRDKGLGLAKSLDVALQVAAGLSYMHQRELVHCDVKPENIFLCQVHDGEDGAERAKLIDFGLSKSMVDDGVKLARSEQGGTPLYSAPEQMQGGAPQPTMDVYPMGVLLYEMVTGKAPFEGAIHEVIERKLATEPPSPSSRTDSPVPAPLESLILRAMARDPKKRPPDMEALIEELQGLSESLDLELPGARRSRPGMRALFTPRPSAVVGERDLLSLASLFPLFVLGKQGKVELATKAFGDLVHAAPNTLLGKALSDTNLSNIFPEVDEVVLEAVSQVRPLHRHISYKARDGRTASLVIWILPELDPQGRVKRLCGIIVPAVS